MPTTKLSERSIVCDHTLLSYASSPYSKSTSFKRSNARQRASAAGRTNTSTDEDEWDRSFPAPLVLPEDDLSYDPYDPQSLLLWTREKERNEVTRQRNAVYVVGQPDISNDIPFARNWSAPKTKSDQAETVIEPPNLVDITAYLAAFYHGLQVKVLPAGSLCFTSWTTTRDKKAKAKPQRVGLKTATETIGVRWRPSPDGVFSGQLNLDDLLDVAISILPEDAYALLMLVDHDLYEDEDDDFCCGRAYGGSRVAVVSMARYNPCLDKQHTAEREHAWPASHCEAYMQSRSLEAVKPSRKKARTAKQMPNDRVSSSRTDKTPAFAIPLQSAISAHKSIMSKEPPSIRDRLAGHWLSRVCQTASHELGHCFALDHCVYYACVMQGTASLAEDVRQPPYLCPVDLAKVLQATGTNKSRRYEALKMFCDQHRHVPMFAAFAAWLGERLRVENNV